MTNFITNIAQKHELTVNTPFLLDNSNSVWWLETGNLHLYTTRFEKKQAIGRRFFFREIKTNDIMLGMKVNENTDEVAFLADATEDSVIWEIPKEIFINYYQDIDKQIWIAEKIEDWIESIFYGIAENQSFPNETVDVLVQKEERLILRLNEKIAAQKEVVWAKINKEKIEHILINGTIKIEENHQQDLILPLTRRSFWQNNQRNLGLKFISTQEALKNQETWKGIEALDSIILTLEKNEILFQTQNEKEKLLQSYTAQYQRTQIALENAKNVLAGNFQKNNFKRLAIDSEDALFLACQMVADFEEINILPPIQKNTPDPIGEIARASQIRYREIKLEGKWYQKNAGAMVAFLQETNQTLALIPDKNNYIAYNTHTQTSQKVDDIFAKKLDKVAYIFYPSFENKALSTQDILNFALGKNKKDITQVLLWGLIGSTLGLLIPILTGILFDEVIPNAAKNQIWQIGLALLFTTIGTLVFQFTENTALLRLETSMDYRLQAGIWDRLLKLPVHFFRNFSVGDLTDRIMGINEIRKILSGMIITGVLGGLFAFLNFILLFFYSVTLALTAFILVALQLAVLYFLGKKQAIIEKEKREVEGHTQGWVLQILTGLTKFRVTGTEVSAYTHWLRFFTKTKYLARLAQQPQNWQHIWEIVLPILSTATLFYTLQKSEINLSTGSFLAFYAAYGAFTGGFLHFSSSLLNVYQIIPLYERAKPILESIPESNAEKHNPNKLKGNIEIANLSFRYEKDAPLALEDISLKIEAGEQVAFVGGSGSGKSTLIRLLLGFEQPEAGVIYFDGQDLGQLDIPLVRRQIGTVLQDSQLMPGDILSNIIGNSPDLTIEDAWEAAKLSAFEEDIKQMPMQMHTIINEGGSTLSGGQKQRLLIAKTLVKKPKIVIFDEATSALDNITQATVTQSLAKLQATRIVIAHRLSTIQNVDKIFVFEQGKIIQQGTYQELLAQEGLFKELAKRQLE
jgi:NHLM bacteriocin system ABC transporter ATP-binding protein